MVHCVCCVCCVCVIARQRKPDAEDSSAQPSKSSIPTWTAEWRQHDSSAAAAAADAAAAAETREENLDRLYEAQSRDCSINEETVNDRIARTLVLDDVLPQAQEKATGPHDTPAHSQAKKERSEKARQEVRHRVARARHLEQQRYQVLDGAHKDTYVLAPGRFTANMTPSQCRGVIVGVVAKMVPGFNKGAISAAVIDLCRTQVPFDTSTGASASHTRYAPALVLNELRGGVMVSKRILVNNRDNILMGIAQGLLEHRHTLPHKHLFGPSSDPNASPFIFDTFMPMQNENEPCHAQRQATGGDATGVMQQTIAGGDYRKQVLIGEALSGSADVAFTCPPSIAFVHAHLSSFAHSDKNVQRYGFLPDVVAMAREKENIRVLQRKWDARFRATVTAEASKLVAATRANGGGRAKSGAWLDTFARAQDVMGPRPRSMLPYPPTNNPPPTPPTPMHQATQWGWHQSWLQKLELDIKNVDARSPSSAHAGDKGSRNSRSSSAAPQHHSDDQIKYSFFDSAAAAAAAQ